MQECRSGRSTTRPAPTRPGWAGETGLVTDAVDRLLPRLSGYDAYLCGPLAMIDAAVELVTRRGVRPRNVYFDAFVPTG
jgi:NAD(P)H-flavin reductase